jgi:hypothetical protein
MEMENQEKETGGDPRSSNLESVLKDVGISSSAGLGDRKKKIMILGVVLVLVIGAGVFYYMNREIKGSPNDYVIQGDIIENKRAGLKIQAPQGWDIQKIELLEGSVAFDSPDIEGEWRNGMINPPLKKGCAIDFGVVYKKMDFKEIKDEIKDIHFGLGMISEEFEEIEINNRKALKNTFDSQVLGPGIIIYFTENNKLYSFGVNWGPDEKERCVKEFEEMLNKIIID